MPGTSEPQVRVELARSRARAILSLTHMQPPVDIVAIIDLAGVPIGERVLPNDARGTIGDIAGRRSIILNRQWRPSSENERRWVLAEELGHVLLGHHLVESTAPGKAAIGLLEQRRNLYEREARAFAAELLMPFAEIRTRCSSLPKSSRSRGSEALRNGREG